MSLTTEQENIRKDQLKVLRGISDTMSTDNDQDKNDQEDKKYYTRVTANDFRELYGIPLHHPW